MEDPIVLLVQSVRSLFTVLMCKRQCDKVLLKYGWEKVPNWECLCVDKEKGLFLSVHVDDIKLVGKKQHINPIGKIFMKDADLGKPSRILFGFKWKKPQRPCDALCPHGRV